MRSRYSAYVLKNENYLLDTWHPSTRPESLELVKDKTHWEKLVILYSSKSEVHFVAFFTVDTNNSKKIFALYEESEFIKEKGCWYYLSGKELKTTELSKNMLCPCQSGKKFKRCCERSLRSF